MKTRSLGATTFAVLLGCSVAGNASELRVLSNAGFAPVLNELGARFEGTAGHKLILKYDAGPVLKRQIEGGETFDVAILNPPAMNDLIKQGKIEASTNATIARAGVGLAVRAGAPKPDISSVEAFKNTLLNAKSVAHSRDGPSGAHFKALLERLGIAGAMDLKLRPLPPGGAPQAVARGEADLVVIVIPMIFSVPGLDFVGPLPTELQTWIVLTAGASAAAQEPQAAGDLIKYLTSESALPAIKANGMEPMVQR